MAGFGFSAPASAQVYIRIGPPAPRHEYYRPRPGYTWNGGHWAWRAGRWIWVGGYWVSGRPGCQWIPGHWSRSWRGNYWVPAHWNC